ncbi:MAG: Zn-ribbon domain-containing OB-fold protein [Alphaproteobacteria bacterium]
MNMIADKLIVDDGGAPALLGARSKETGEITFPAPQGMEAERFDELPLKREGTLWSYTIQRFPPKEPYIGEMDMAKFKPFAVGYIELADQVIVEARIDTDDVDALKVGQKMVLSILEFAQDADGSPVHTYAFKPV